MLEGWIDRVRKDKLRSLEIILLLAVGIGLRFFDLGYSDFQGDEISAICRPSNFNTVIKFLGYLLGQKKGPVQYVITCAYGLVDPAFSSELLLRLPFALANVLALVCLFLVALHLFDRQSAIFATFLVAASGMFIAFGRMVQYQSFVIFGVTASLLFVTLAGKFDRWRIPGLYIGFAAAAGALLAHFDAAFVLPPLGVLSFHWWQEAQGRNDTRRLVRHLVAATVMATLVLLAFYGEYAHRISQSSLQYWESRIAGPPTNPITTASFYAPAMFVWVSLAAALLGLLRFQWNLGWQVLLAWLIPPLIFHELIFGDSRTHIYVYILPLLIVAGVGLAGVVAWAKRRLGPLVGEASRVVVLLFLVLDAYAGYVLLVDHTTEYPWNSKTVLGTTMPGGDGVATFGFPYDRQWRAIGSWFAAQPDQALAVTTNEKLSIARFYLPANVDFKYIWRDAPEKPPDADRIYFLVIRLPQSWTDQLWGRTFSQWHAKFAPAVDFTNDQGDLVASIYVLSASQYRSATGN